MKDGFQAEFDKMMSEFKDNNDFFKFLFEHRSANGLSCIRCASTDLQLKERKVNCNKCKYRFSVTTGTPFQDLKYCRQMMAGIRLREAGIVFGPSDLEEAARIAYSTAWEMCARLNLVFAELLQQSSSTVHCGEFFPVLFRRSRESKENLHPTAAMLEDVAASEAENNSDRADPHLLNGLSDMAKNIQTMLLDGPMQVDAMIGKLDLTVSEISMYLWELESSRLIRMLAGNRYELAQPTSQKNDRKLAASSEDTGGLWRRMFEKFCRDNFQGVSRKYVQLFLCLFWNTLKQIKWDKNGVFHFFIQHPPITRANIIGYHSPMNLVIPA